MPENANGNEELATLAAVGRVLTRALEPAELVGEALAELLPALGLDLGAVYLLQGEEFVLVAQRGLSPGFARAAARHPKDHPILGQVVRTGTPIATDDSTSPHAIREGIKHAVYFPLIAKGSPLGVLAMGHRSGRKLAPKELVLLEAAAAQLGLALGQAEAHREAMELLERHKLLVENELVGIYVIQDGRLAYVNAGFCRMSGYAKEELLGRDPLELVHPEDRERVRENLARRLRGDTALPSYRFRGLRKDGSTAHVEVFAQRIAYGGQPAVQGILHDITWEAEAERLRKSLLEVAGEILAAGDVGHILRRVAQAIVDHSPFQRAAVSLYDLTAEPPLAGPVVQVYSAGLTPAEERELLAQGGLSPQHRQAAFHERFRISCSYYIPHDEVPWEPTLGIPGRASQDGWHPDDFLLIPLRGKRGIIGHISVDDPTTPRAPTLGMLEPLEVFADLAAVAVERAAELEELRRHKEWLRGAFRIAQELTRYPTLNELVQGVLDILKRELRYEYGVVLLADGDGLLVAAADSSLPGRRFDVGHRFPLDQGIIGWVVEHREPALINDVAHDPRYVMGHPDVRSELAVPIQLGSELIGVLNIESTVRNRFRIEDQEFLSTVASLLAVAIDVLRTREELKQIAIHDPLTGLYNRRYLTEVIERELERSRRYGHPLTLLMLDLDHFRTVNNRFGHKRGDEVLREISDLLVKNVRSADMVFRYGGDEFMVLMPETGSRAEEVVSRLREAVREWSQSSGFDFEIGISVGMSVWRPEDGRRVEDVLEEADHRMYLDKGYRLGHPG
ncbi:MAG: diguanylate cyclase [Candidatus Acetothermia bacterium]|nr:diguanylate cyclase [Candidatus Acetothermia bacterium]